MVDWCQQVMGFLAFPLLLPETGETGRSTITQTLILKFFQVDITGMFRMTSSARYFKDGVGSSCPNWR